MRAPLALAAAAVVMAFALGLLVPTTVFAQGSGEWIKFVFTPQAGYNSTCLTCGWHTGECKQGVPPGPALDFGGSSDCSDSQHNVYFRTFAFLGPGSPSTYVGRAAAEDVPGTTCKTVKVRIWDTGTSLLGEMRYVHTYLTYPGIIWLYANEYGYENEEVVAHMADPDNPGCPTEGPHLHELHYDGASTFFLRNDGICGTDCDERYPCGPQYPYCYDIDPRDWSEWVRAFCIDDTDCDGWTDDEESYIGTDPLDNCPNNPSHAAWPLDINNDTAVTVVGDVLNYSGRIGDTGPPRYDLNADGAITVVGDVLLYRGMIGASCT